MNHRNVPHTTKSLLARTHKQDTCRIWTGANTSQGYGVATYMGKQTTTHRIMFLLSKGEIPDGYEIHHKCQNRLCINPRHLEAVSHAENMALDRELRRTCKAGHEWNEENTYLAVVKRKQGGMREQRYCRACRAQHQADWRARRTT